MSGGNGTELTHMKNTGSAHRTCQRTIGDLSVYQLRWYSLGNFGDA
jgi:hypothetical protein